MYDYWYNKIAAGEILRFLNRYRLFIKRGFSVPLHYTYFAYSNIAINHFNQFK